MKNFVDTKQPLSQVFVLFSFSRMLLFSFLIGTSMQAIWVTVQQVKSSITTTTSINILTDIKSKIRTAKLSLSPILFMVFSKNCLMIINCSLNLAITISNTTDNFKLSMLSMLIYTAWELFYIAYIVDGTVDYYNSLSEDVR